MLDILFKLADMGAAFYSNVSGGKDGQAMTAVLAKFFPITGLVHADLGSIEWKESLPMCERLSEEFGVPLYVVRRTDGRSMVEHWRARMQQLKRLGSLAPFWSSSEARYCTSDMKRDPIDKFYRNCGNDIVISCEGIRAEESDERKKKEPLSIRWKITSSYYRGMTVEEAVAAYKPGKRLALNFYPVFYYSKEDVWNTYGMTGGDLWAARAIYKAEGIVPSWWPFHPAYVYGNDRVSCVFCVLGCGGDLAVGAEHRPELLEELIIMEDEGCATFKNGWSLKELKK